MSGRSSWHGDLGGPRTRRITDALHKLTGRRPSVERSGDGGTRILLRVIEQPDATQTLAVLRILALGDTYGHDRTARWQKLWVDVAEGREGADEPAAELPAAVDH